MPLDLTKNGISQADPDYVAITGDLQGNIVTSHGRNFTGQLLVQFDPDKRTLIRAFLKKLAQSGRITSAKQQKADADLFKQQTKAGKTITQKFFRGLYLTATGYKALGFADEDIEKFTDEPFRNGMKASQGALHDPLVTAWEGGYRSNGDALFLFAHSNEATLKAKMVEFSGVLRDEGKAKILAAEFGKGFTNAVGDHLEHFGYVDGISQPDFFTQSPPLLHKHWDPIAPLGLVLVPDPLVSSGKSFGSYYVFRKLEQNVQGFKQMEKELATALQLGTSPGLTDKQREDEQELAGALVVGRFENGMPVTMSKTAGSVSLKDNEIGKINDFTYGQTVNGVDDLSGGRCPFQGHIRKTNPRGTGGAESPANERGHLMARRGITYGERLIEPKDEPEIEEMPTEGVGLLFASFQSDIVNQFEFTQRNWANFDRFPFSNPGTTGIDPVIGQVPPGATITHKFSKIYNNSSAGNQVSFGGFGNFVTMKGGEYFFAPSLTFFKGL
ncbi:MAG: peroxidase [Spirosoma sp.]|nr:peroxidase [Spirosoma sp.]